MQDTLALLDPDQRARLEAVKSRPDYGRKHTLQIVDDWKSCYGCGGRFSNRFVEYTYCWDCAQERDIVKGGPMAVAA